jgi:hypothetical protein
MVKALGVRRCPLRVAEKFIGLLSGSYRLRFFKSKLKVGS